MYKYTAISNNKDNRTSSLKILLNSKSNIQRTKEKIFICTEKLNEMLLQGNQSNSANYNESIDKLKEQISYLKKKLNYLEKNYSRVLKKFNNVLIKSTITTSLGLILLFTIQKSASQMLNEKVENNISKTIEQIDITTLDNDDDFITYRKTDEDDKESAEKFLNLISEYADISKIENPTHKEEKYKNEIISQIAKMPEEMTQLAFNNLKKKIAKKIGESNYESIQIFDKSATVSAGRTELSSGSYDIKEIKCNGRLVATHEIFYDLNTGEKYVKYDEIPKNLLKVIEKVFTAIDTASTQDAINALKAVHELDVNEFKFNYAKDKDEER